MKARGAQQRRAISMAAAAVACGVFGLLTPCAQADINWDGDNSVGNFSFNNNWFGDSQPTWGFGSGNLVFSFRNNAGQTSLFYDYGSWRQINDIIWASTFPAGLPLNSNGNGIDFNQRIENRSSHTQTVNMPLSGAKNGAGQIEFNPVNGDLTLNGSIFNDNNKPYQVFGSNGKTVTLNTALGGNSGVSFTLKQSSQVVFSKANTYGGDTTIETGTISYAAGGATNSPFHRIGVDGSSSDATLRITDTDGGTTLINGIVVRTGPGARRIQATNSSGTNTFSGNVFMDGNVETNIASGGTIAFSGATFDLKNQTLTINGDGNTYVENGIKNPGAGETGSLIKSGSGRAYVHGGSTYRGTTTITTGRLYVNGTHTGAGSYSINTNGTLAGSGEITLAGGRNVTIAGTISPGESAGELTLNTSAGGVTDFAQGGSYSWEINSQTGAAGVAWDLLDLDAVAVTASTNGFTIKIVSLNGSNQPGPTPGWVAASPTQPKKFTIATSSTNSFTIGMLDKFTIDTSQFQDAYPTGWSLAIGNSGGSLDLVYVPEPGTFAGVIFAAAATLTRRNRRKRIGR